MYYIITNNFLDELNDIFNIVIRERKDTSFRLCSHTMKGCALVDVKFITVVLLLTEKSNNKVMKKPFEKVSFFHSWQSFLLCFETNPCDLIHQNFAARVHLDTLAFELCAKNHN